MNIALIRRRFSPTGGAERYLVRLAEGLQARGHDLTLYCEAWTPQESPFARVVTVPSNDPFTFARLLENRPLKKEHQVVFSLERVPGCHVYRAGDGLHAEWLAHRHRVSPILGRIKTLLRSKNRAFCRLEAAVFDPERTERIICNSHFIAKQVTDRFEFPPERLDIVPNGVPVQTFKSGDRANGRAALGISPEEYVVLLVGAGAERKGHRYAQEAIRLCQSPVRFVLVDSPPPAAMPDVYAAADVFFLPTLYDPFANVTLEALAAGLPVITTAQNGASEIMTPGKEGFVLRRPNLVQEAAILIDELADESYRSTFREPAQRLAEKYDLSRNIEETLAVLGKVGTG